MKRVIRKCVWETNSSTSHSTVIMTADQYKRWEEENLYYYPPNKWYDPFEKLSEDQKPVGGCLYTQEEVLQFYKLAGYEEYDPNYYGEEEFTEDDYIREMGDFIGYGNWSEDEYLENDTNYYTTPGGEEIVVCCKYGNDY